METKVKLIFVKLIFMSVLYCLSVFVKTCLAVKYHVNYEPYPYGRNNFDVVNFPITSTFVISSEKIVSVNTLQPLNKLPSKSKPIPSTEMIREINMRYKNFIKKILDRKNPLLITKNKPKKIVIYFKFDSAEITEDQKQHLLKEIDSYKKEVNNGSIYAEVYGYADCIGSESYNKELSLKRAANVAKLLEKAGIIPEKIEGLGETEESKILCLNRKVEVFLKLKEKK